MATLTLKKKNNSKPVDKARPDGERRAPLRGKGVSRPRQTLEQAQAERQERQAEFEQRRAREDARPAAPRGRPEPRPDARPGPRGDARAEPRRDARPAGGSSFRREDGPAPEPRRDQRRASGPRPSYPTQGEPYGQAPRPAPRQRAEHREMPSDEGERLSKRMSELGMASRREADEWIAAGWVRVDGKMAVLGQRVGPDVRIEVDQRAHKEQAKQVTILLHKPIGYVSGQAEDGYEPASVLVRSNTQWADDASGIKYHIGHTRGLAPAGRLDIDSTGLLVLTQDGRVAKVLIGEDSDVEKEYLVRVEFVGLNGEPVGPGRASEQMPPERMALLAHGLELDGVKLKPAKVSWANEDQLRVVLREGRKRQIRRMCELVGLKVVGLKRVRIGRINLGHLPVGQWRFLAPWERFD
ncbi:pseudouridine synthase [Paucibacter soli]|uniref:pseudouridine synthase n=1 Tax=Paucibacter soli TaxID=3133433 RepID=UPI0030A6FEDE